jgi:hypothetical protein
MDDWTTEECEAWWQAFTQSVNDWRLWEKYEAIEDQLNGVMNLHITWNLSTSAFVRAKSWRTVKPKPS